MPEESPNQAAAEVVFDVSRAAQDIQFLGLVTGLEESHNELTGLFDWTCPGCSFHNRSSAIIEPEQAFLARWLCTTCGRTMLVRFRSRATTEWIAQHALVVAGATLGAPADPAATAQTRRRKAAWGRGKGQKVFALVAIPALLLLILLASSDLPPIASGWARASGQGGRPSGVVPSARLPGYWVSKAGDHSLYFGHIDASTKRGTYVPVYKSRKPCPWVRFVVVREETDGVEIVIRELDEQGNAVTHADTIFYLSQEGTTLIRVSIAPDQPALTVYDAISYKPGRR